MVSEGETRNMNTWLLWDRTCLSFGSFHPKLTVFTTLTVFPNLRCSLSNRSLGINVTDRWHWQLGHLHQQVTVTNRSQIKTPFWTNQWTNGWLLRKTPPLYWIAGSEVQIFISILLTSVDRWRRHLGGRHSSRTPPAGRIWNRCKMNTANKIKLKNLIMQQRKTWKPNVIGKKISTIQFKILHHSHVHHHLFSGRDIQGLFLMTKDNCVCARWAAVEPQSCRHVKISAKFSVSVESWISRREQRKAAIM